MWHSTAISLPMEGRLCGTSRYSQNGFQSTKRKGELFLERMDGLIPWQHEAGLLPQGRQGP